MTDIEKEVLRELTRLGSDEQKRVLEFTKSMSAPVPRGSRGADLLPFAGTIGREDLQQMEAAIESDCEQVNAVRDRLTRT